MTHKINIMKKLKLLFAPILAIALFACQGPQGPPGFDGFDGEDGIDGKDAVFGTVFEIEGSFSEGNEYTLFYEFPQTFEVFESDLVLVYILFEQLDDAEGGAPIDVWRLLPQTRILDQGLLQYNYDHTFLDVSVFLEADFDLASLPPGDTDNQVFRIAVVPAEFGEDSSIDLNNLDAVMSNMNIRESNVDKVLMD
jgi:hypothetical protein